MVRWVRGSPWPLGERWVYPAPTFPRSLGGPIELVEILDEDEFPELGYRVTDPDRLQIPDFLGRVRSGAWVLYESKSDNHLDTAVNQLDDGLAEFTRLGIEIQKLGIVLNKVESNEEFFVMKNNGLLSHKRLLPGDVIRLGANKRLPVMVEERRRKSGASPI